MEEVGGPVVAIALILAAVFIPTAAIPGITGRLYQQFAVTIAISVLISAFNALTLSPGACRASAEAARRRHARGACSAQGFDRVQQILQPHHGQLRPHIERPHSQVRLRHDRPRRASQCSTSSWAASLPGGFIPTEDQGYMFLALQLPDGASAQRTDAAQQKITDALLKTPGIEGVIAVTDFSLLTQVQSTNTGFFFVTLKPWEVRKSKTSSSNTSRATCRNACS